MLETDINSIGEALSPLVEKYNKAFEVTADGRIAELDTASFMVINEEAPEAAQLLGCSGDQCFRTYPRCPDGKTLAICINRGNSVWVPFAQIRNGQWECSSMKLTCP